MKDCVISELSRRLFWLGFLTGALLIWFCLAVRAEMTPRPALARTVEYTSQDQPDPFLSPFEMQGVPPKPPPIVDTGISHLEVQGIVWNTRLPQAIINNTVVRTGEVISGAEILDIRKEGVYVLYEDRQYILRPRLQKK